MPSLSKPEPGQLVGVRQRRYLVEDVVPPPELNQATLVRLSCVDDDAQGQALEVLWERELDARVLSDESWWRVAEKGFDPPAIFAGYLRALRWRSVTATDPKLFQSPFRAGIRLDAYQLEPLRKALLLPRVNLFIADDVGLGKTIEAGLIARELILRRKVKDIVVMCPPSMLPQWQGEMEARFGLTFEVLDRDYIARVRRERGYAVNPWTTHTRFLVSHRLLIDEAYATPLRDWLGTLRPGTLLILDEAHHAAPASGIRYAIDSRITRAVRDLAPRFEHRLFLSATPHNGHSNSFSALLEILDPQRFCRGVPVERGQLEAVMVRRLKEDIRRLDGGFPRRVVRQCDIDGLPDDAPELVLPELLEAYRRLREQRLAGASKRVQTVSGLLISGLQQRLLSSIEAFARTLRVHRRTVLRQWEGDGGSRMDPGGLAARQEALELVAGAVGSDDDRATVDESELAAEEEAQVEAASATGLGPLTAAAERALFERELSLLDWMTEIADAARGQPDARVRQLVDWIRAEMCPDLPPLGAARHGSPAKWNHTRVLIFTEYDDTKRYLRQQLELAIAGTDRADARIEVYHGPTPPEKREEIKRRFNTDPAREPLRILIATDAAREGLNLQAHCWNLFHFDVPWNPGRLEQRNGRIDRKLQPRPEVFCHYFVYGQRAEDRILQALVRKTDTIQEELGSLSVVLEARLAETLKAGIRRDRVVDIERSIDAAALPVDERAVVEEELEATRTRRNHVADQVERLRDQLAASRRWIALEKDQLRQVLDAALALQGAGPLQPLPADGWVGPARFRFPALDAGDASWAETIDALRAPRRPGQPLWEWRRQAPVRPVVFDDPGVMSEEVVQLHLEHRVVQRLLHRFQAQGFVHHDLSRACLTQTEDPIPRVILLGRLTLYGSGAARLHEEIIPVTARWREPDRRAEPLKPYARDAEQGTLKLLESALSELATHVPEQVRARLRMAAREDVQALLPHLLARGEVVADEAEQQLLERGRREAAAMRGIIEGQLNRVRQTAREGEAFQLQLLADAPQDEVRQLESNRRYWASRVETLAEELVREPDRVRAVYTVRSRRVEPVGLAYLWPVTG